MLPYVVIVGIALIALELVVPGGVLAPLGVAALLVAGLMWAGLVESWVSALTAWFILSLILVGVFRVVFRKLMPGDESRGSTDEDGEAFDNLVEVTETIPQGGEGRISFRGSSWPAVCYDRTLEPGDKATIFYRDGMRWVVTPAVDPLTGDAAAPSGR